MSGEYTIGDHPSDLELTIRGADLTEIFSTAARAAAETAAPGAASGREVERRIELSAPNREELLVAWLNEIIYLLQVERFRPERFDFSVLSSDRLLALVRCRRAGPAAFSGGSEIKAATYHGLSIRETPSGWVAHVILDL
ncbi:MAG: archease [Candidatus Aureabacteria bacterium]|nr:archease [Candidatus Auribacterota bacterium]